MNYYHQYLPSIKQGSKQLGIKLKQKANKHVVLKATYTSVIKKIKEKEKQIIGFGIQFAFKKDKTTK